MPVLWMLWSADTPAKTEPSPEDSAKSGARYACQEFIADSLHNPESAEWGMSSGNWYASWPARIDGDGVTVQADFRATNALGALILTRWTCAVSKRGDFWRLVSLKEH